MQGGTIKTAVQLACLTMSSAVFAAPPPPDAGTLLDQVGGSGRQQLKAAPAMGVTENARPAMKAESGFKVAVKGFRVTGSTAFQEKDLLALIADEVGREHTMSSLDEVAAKVTRYYRSKGYFLATAYIPKQEVRDGIIEIAVMEGRVGRIDTRLKGARISQEIVDGVLGTAVKSGDLITEQGLERGLLLLNDLAGVSVESTVQPGEAVGTADLVADVTSSGMVSGSVELDNYGSRYTGQQRVTGSVGLNSPFGIGDNLSLKGLESDTGEMKFARLAYVAPVGYYGTKLGVAYSDMQYKLGREFKSLKQHGTATVNSVFAFHPLVRSRNFNVLAQAGYDMKSLSDKNDSAPSINDKDNNVMSLGLSGDSRDGLGGGGMNLFSVVHYSGDLKLNTAAVRANDQSVGNGLKTSGNFNKTNYSFSRLQAITDSLSLYMMVAGQAASKNLDSSEKFSLGGPNAVRAYPQGEHSADEAILYTGELRWVVPGFAATGLPGDLSLTGFYDYARGKLNKSPLAVNAATNTKDISGYGFGLNWGRAADFAVRATLAWRGPDRVTSEPDTSTRFWLQGIKWF